ncbi:PfkB family carbohydrate kinase [Aureimonas pseudogalii]|uniref:Ribokinase n=1 Tax=Aureimonas pseudogalii TaxID=1744844 RepID=A0A7W6H5J7_9HYPH|nr:PfkB family carbohydrate kinase [Aureimonas pseudogalii]MBB3998944.1 ribokinase [Aureimonas pseudogalii]
MIVVFGSVNVDLVCRVAAIPKPGETVLAPGYERLSGGKGANQAVAAARAGAKTHFAGAVGRDAFGEDEAGTLEAEGIDVAALARLNEPTGCAFITVASDGENAITVASGANRLADASGLSAVWAHQPTALVLQMELPFEETVSAARAARDHGVPVLLNLAPVPVGVDSGSLRALLAATDLLVVNEHELAETATILGLAAGEPAALALAVAAETKLGVLATLGAEGAILVEADGGIQRFAAPPIRPVDTTGAGDTLCGVLAAGLDAGLSRPDAVRRAVAAASLACLGFGARAMPRAAEIDAFLPGGAA